MQLLAHVHVSLGQQWDATVQSITVCTAVAGKTCRGGQQQQHPQPLLTVSQCLLRWLMYQLVTWLSSRPARRARASLVAS